MYRVSVQYGTPDDPAEFDRYYRDVHIPIAKKMTGLTAWTLTWITDQADVPADVYLIADLYADSKEVMDAILASDAGVAAADDVANFATGGATFLYGSEESVL
ncbi:EthD family reductase [soil metagenome]